MKTPVLASLAAILFASAAPTATAREFYSDADGPYRRHHEERGRCAEPEVLFDRYGNKVIFVHGRRIVIPAEERCHHASGQFSPAFGGGLRLIFPR